MPGTLCVQAWKHVGSRFLMLRRCELAARLSSGRVNASLPLSCHTRLGCLSICGKYECSKISSLSETALNDGQGRADIIRGTDHYCTDHCCMPLFRFGLADYRLIEELRLSIDFLFTFSLTRALYYAQPAKDSALMGIVVTKTCPTS